MQVLTNQAPAPEQVGRFTVIRNSAAGFAKSGFALGAGFVVDAFGLSAAWGAVALLLLIFGLLWWLVSKFVTFDETGI